jgi:hypothetical protein
MLMDSRLTRCLRDGKQRSICGVPGNGYARRRALSPAQPACESALASVRRHAGELRESGRIRRPVEQQVIERFIACGDPHHGFARIYCDAYMLRAPMRVIALIDDPGVVRRMLEHLGPWAPEPAERGHPPHYHAVPDIA